jgi:hypothetical protein
MMSHKDIRAVPGNDLAEQGCQISRIHLDDT